LRGALAVLAREGADGRADLDAVAARVVAAVHYVD
jgi:hypothetical protein